ncbi:hypothetical protein ACLB2K_035095 [Fragaria x ananassa]
MGTCLFNGKEFSKLCLDDLKDVYFPTVLETGKKKGQDVNLEAKAGEKRSRRGLVSRGVRYTRVGCLVEFAVRYCNEKRMYHVRHFVHKHSHELGQPNKVHFLRSNRNVEDRDAAQVQWLRGFFLELADEIQGFGLNILKGDGEPRG